MTQPSYITLADGTLIDTATGKQVVSTEINKAFSDDSKTSMLRPGAGLNDLSRRYIDDLPCTPDQSRAIFAIMAARVFGLIPMDVARIFGIKTENVQSIEESEPYAKMLEAILANIREHDQNKIRKKINRAAEKAADTITSLIESSDEKVSFAASKDILDRATRNQNDNGANILGGLTIRIIDERESPAKDVEVSIDG